MNKCYIPTGYQNPLTVYETQRAIEFIKRNFQSESVPCAESAPRVSAPLVCDEESSGLNDNLNGVRAPGQLRRPRRAARRVRSSTRWPNGSACALKRYNFRTGKGLVTDMNAIRRDESAG